ncbi:MAG: PAS domain S-box protein [Candidatus Thermoplasmatota archaeon]|nr:PAS domain S-box protein [Candidatus Thermoplasmatota archaeon]
MMRQKHDQRMLNIGHTADASIEEQVNRLQLIANNTEDVILQASLSSRITFMGASCYPITGYTPEEVIGRSFTEFVPKKELPKYFMRIKDLVVGKNVNDFETYILHKNGYPIPVEFSGKLIGEGNKKFINAVMRDISKRKQVAQELKELNDRLEHMVRVQKSELHEANNRYRLIMEYASDLIATVSYDNDMRFIYVSPSHKEELGHPMKHLVGSSLFEYIHEEDTEKLSQVRNYLLDHKFKGLITGTLKAQYLDLRIRDMHGSWHDIEMSLTPLDSEIVLISRDITERKRSVEEIQRKNVELQELDALKTAFLNTTSHELRTPMTMVKGYVEMLASGILGSVNADQRKSLDVVLRNIDRLNRLVQDIFDISGLESHTMRFQPKSTDVGKLVEQTVETMWHFAQGKSIRIDTTVSNGLSEIVVDGDRIQQVLMNLLDNAIKFSPCDSEISVNVGRADDVVVFEVRDCGCGVPPNEVNRIFESFYQVDYGVDRRYNGIGLGLAICRGIVGCHGGKIWVENCVGGRGCVFRFTLPVNPVIT